MSDSAEQATTSNGLRIRHVLRIKQRFVVFADQGQLDSDRIQDYVHP